jgi:hypothetical protein
VLCALLLLPLLLVAGCILRCFQSSKRQEVGALIEELESLNPLQQPTQHLDQLAGKWLLLYTTIQITVRMGLGCLMCEQ